MPRHVLLEVAKRPMTAAVKVGAGAGFDTLERWLGDADMLVIRDGEQLPMAVMPWRTFRRIAEVSEVPEI